MISPDVNVLISAWWSDAADHQVVAGWLEDNIETRTLAVSELVISGAIRILTNPKLSALKVSRGGVLSLADGLRASLGEEAYRPGRRHWPIFRRIVDETGATGNEISDCYHAALAVEHGYTWASADQFFAKVSDLDWLDTSRLGAG